MEFRAVGMRPIQTLKKKSGKGQKKRLKNWTNFVQGIGGMMRKRKIDNFTRVKKGKKDMYKPYRGRGCSGAP